MRKETASQGANMLFISRVHTDELDRLCVLNRVV